MASYNTIQQGSRWSTYTSNLSPAMKRFKKLHVRKNALTNKILWDKDRAVGVEFTDENGRSKRISVKNEVILSAGAIKTAQILQLSGVGPSHVLEPLDVRFTAPIILYSYLSWFLRYQLLQTFLSEKIFRITYKFRFLSNYGKVLASTPRNCCNLVRCGITWLKAKVTVSKQHRS